MGVSYYVHLGPYIEVNGECNVFKELTKNACVNADCSKFSVNAGTHKFCPECGVKIELIKTVVKEPVDPEYLIHNLGIDEEIHISYCSDKKFFFPNKGVRSWDVKYDEVLEDLSKLNVAEEIEKVKVTCARAIEALEKAYGCEPVVKYGLISEIN